MPTPFRLVIRSGPRTGQIIPLEAEELTIGRETTNTLVIEDPEVSRSHARIYAQGRSYFIEDRGSTNGTSVNGQRIVAPYMLQNGDLITLGENTNLVFEGTSLDQAATIASVPAGMPGRPQPEASRAAPPPPPPIQVPPQPARTNYAPPPPAPYAAPVDPYPPQAGYNAQVFDAAPEAPVAPRRKLSTLVIVLLILVGCLLFACIIFAVIDTLNLYCTLLPGIVNTFVPGYCP